MVEGAGSAGGAEAPVLAAGTAVCVGFVGLDMV